MGKWRLVSVLLCSCYSVRSNKSVVARRTKKIDRALPISDQNELDAKTLKHPSLEDKAKEERRNRIKIEFIKAVANQVVLYKHQIV